MKIASNKNDTGRNARQTSRLAPKAQELLQERRGFYPVWIYVPKNGACPWIGFSRAKLYELAGNGNIRTVPIREPGQPKSARVFHTQLILNYITRCEQDALREYGRLSASPKSSDSNPFMHFSYLILRIIIQMCLAHIIKAIPFFTRWIC